MGAKRRRGFTLLEAVVALVMLGVIMSALSFSVSAALSASKAAQERRQEGGDARSIFGFLQRDLQAAFASNNNPVSLFVASGGGGGRSGADMGLLSFTTRSNRMTGFGLSEEEEPNAPQPSASNNSASAPPQSDVALVRYDFDTNTGVLSRFSSGVPSLSSLGQSGSGPETTVGEHLVDIRFRFWDAENRAWRTEWDYQQRNQAKRNQSASSPNANGGTNASSGGGAGGSGGAGGGGADETTGDKGLPSSIEITLELRRPDGSVANYRTLLSVVAPIPIPQPPAPPTDGANPNNANNPNNPNPNNPNSGGTPSNVTPQ